MGEHDLGAVFDRVMREPSSQRGLDVGVTCRLLAAEVRKEFPAGEFSERMRAMEEYYMNQFMHTMLLVPDFADRIRKAMKKYVR